MIYDMTDVQEKACNKAKEKYGKEPTMEFDSAGQMNLYIDGFIDGAEHIQAKIKEIEAYIQDTYEHKISDFFDSYKELRSECVNLQKDVDLYQKQLSKAYNRIRKYVSMPWYKRLFNLKVLFED